MTHPTSQLRKGTRVVMVDRYAARAKCTCPRLQASSFDGMRGEVVSLAPFMVLLEDENKPMRFDERDFDPVPDDG